MPQPSGGTSDTLMSFLDPEPQAAAASDNMDRLNPQSIPGMEEVLGCAVSY